MKILAVDTSGKEMGICVFSGKTCLEERYVAAERAYNRHILPLISAALGKAGIKLSDVDIFGATRGPGSFTGIRVGMAVMKAFAYALDKKFTGVSVLDIIASSAAGEKQAVWAVLEAGRDEVYAGHYGTGNGIPGAAAKKKYLLLNREKFIKMLKKGDVIAGITGEAVITEAVRKKSKINVVQFEHIDMKRFAEIIQRGNGTEKNGLYSVSPVYIRASEAEVRLKMKKRGGKIK